MPPVAVGIISWIGEGWVVPLDGSDVEFTYTVTWTPVVGVTDVLVQSRFEFELSTFFSAADAGTERISVRNTEPDAWQEVVGYMTEGPNSPTASLTEGFNFMIESRVANTGLLNGSITFRGSDVTAWITSRIASPRANRAIIIPMS